MHEIKINMKHIRYYRSDPDPQKKEPDQTGHKTTDPDPHCGFTV